MMPENEYYEKNRENAHAEMKKGGRFTKRTIMTYGEHAELDKEMLAALSAFMDYAEENEVVQAYLYLRYYTAYQSGESFTGSEYEKLPLLPEAEEKFPGFCEVAIGLSAEEVFRAYLEEKNIAEFVDEQSYYTRIRRGMQENKIAHNTYGFHEYSGIRHNWAQGTILRIGRLVYEKKTFYDYIEVYKKGNTYVNVALPGWKYTKEGYIGERGEGTPPVYEVKEDILRCRIYSEAGNLQPDEVFLPLSEYDLFLKPGDPVYGIHIPGDGKLTEESVDESLSLAKKVMEREGGPVRKFMCTSWLLDPQLQLILPPESNIIKFQKRFRPISTWINGFSVYKHIFEVAPCPLSELVPRNRFQKAILDSLKGGRPMRHGHGFLDI